MLQRLAEAEPRIETDPLALNTRLERSRDLFGAGKLPEIGSGIGKGIKNFKDATSKEEKAKKLDEEKPDDKNDNTPA